MATARRSKKPTLISLFSGGMGLDIGLEEAGFESRLCVEIDKAAVSTIRLNKPKLPVIHDSVAKLTGSDLLAEAGLTSGEVDLLAGGPPCQAFSVIGNRSGLTDTRGQLVFDYIRLVDEIRPRTFIMENVRGLLSMPIDSSSKSPALKKPGALLQKILDDFEALGYDARCFVVNSVNYGAPQIRERLIIIGTCLGRTPSFPEPQYSNRPEDKLPPFRTLRDVIGPGFVDPYPDVMNFSPRKLHYLSMIPPGGNWRSLPEDIQKESMGKTWYLKGGRSAYWRKLAWDFPSPTVVTMPNHASTSMCHPEELRAITIGEAAAIQEFPPTWQFAGSTTEKFRQIGNAVPIRLGKVAGEQAKILLQGGGERHIRYADSRIIHLRPHVRTRSFWRDGESLAGESDYYTKKPSDQLSWGW